MAYLKEDLEHFEHQAPCCVVLVAEAPLHTGEELVQGGGLTGGGLELGGQAGPHGGQAVLQERLQGRTN